MAMVNEQTHTHRHTHTHTHKQTHMYLTHMYLLFNDPLAQGYSIKVPRGKSLYFLPRGGPDNAFMHRDGDEKPSKGTTH